MKTILKLLPAIFLFFYVTVHGQQRISIYLNDHWKVAAIPDNLHLTGMGKELEDSALDWYEGDMPKQVQEFIFENGELPDPAVGDNCQKWVGVFQKEWIYTKDFETPRFKGDIHLCFNGLDTEVDVILNGEKIAYCNNMFRRWRIPVTGKLKAEGKMNKLVLIFYPPQKIIDEFVSRYPEAKVVPHKYVRKTDSDFKSYMGSRPHFIKMGIFDDVYLDLLPEAYLGDIQVQSFLDDNFSSAEIKINPDIQGAIDHSIEYKIYQPDDEVLAKGKASPGSFTVTIEKPQLWYPMNYGNQPMYKIELSLKDRGKLLDRAVVEFGIRDLKIIQKDEQTGNPLFCIQVNGKKIFMNGACWAPLHGFTHVWDEARADTLLKLMKLGNMNFTRVWGEGSNPGTSFFEFCDRNGIMIMMDFMTCSPIQQPIYDDGFRENITLEIEDVVKRYRNHPSMAFWDGGNEHYLTNKSNLGDNTLPVGRALFQKMMPEAVSKYDPQRYYHPSSPWGGDNWINGNDPLAGDFHDYSTVRFQPLSSVPLFTTEVCMVSPYAAHNMKRFMSEEEFWPGDFKFVVDRPGKKAWPPGWEHHSIGSAWDKTGRYQDYCDIQTGEDACRVLGLAHGQYLKERYERQRRGVPDGGPDKYRRSWGAAVWRLNDTWPMIYMSVVDYYLEPKIPYYFLKRACEPLLISFEQTDDKFCVWVVNDTPEPVRDSLVVELASFDGKVKQRCTRWVELQSSEAKRVVDLTHEFYEMQKRNEFLVARLGEQVKSHLMYPEKFLKLKDGTIRVEVEKDMLILESETFIKSLELSLPGVSGAIFSDNYFDLIPGYKKQVSIVEKKDGTKVRIKGLNSGTEIVTLNIVR